MNSWTKIFFIFPLNKIPPQQIFLKVNKTKKEEKTTTKKPCAIHLHLIFHHQDKDLEKGIFQQE